MSLIVVEAISKEFRVALPWEQLYADDLAVIAETEEELIKRLNEWKDNVESKGMRVNMNKTKVSGERQMVWQKAARWPCGVCNKGVGSNSLQGTRCQKWVHKKCSGIKGSMSKVAKSFICRGCLNRVTSAVRTSVDIGASAKLELVDKFCYLGDMLSVDGDADAAALLSTFSFLSFSLLISSSSVSAITAKSSAYSSSHGRATLNSLDMASMTITNNSGLNPDPWCIPTFTSKPLLLP